MKLLRNQWQKYADKYKKSTATDRQIERQTCSKRMPTDVRD